MAENNKKSGTSKKAAEPKASKADKTAKTAAKTAKTKGRGRPKMTEAEKAQAKIKREANKKAGKTTSAKKTSGSVLLTLKQVQKLVGNKSTAKIEVTQEWHDAIKVMKENPKIVESIKKYS